MSLRRPHRLALRVVVAIAAAALVAAGSGWSTTKPPVEKSAPKAASAGGPGKSGRRLVTLRGEVVDYYCYIEKGARGPTHHECATRCVAGDVCMGLVTTEGDLYMVSVNHLRAMEPLAFKGIPDPFNRCRGYLTRTVDLTGYAMERSGQRIVEIMDVTPVEAPAPSAPK